MFPFARASHFGVTLCLTHSGSMEKTRSKQNSAKGDRSFTSPHAFGRLWTPKGGAVAPELHQQHAQAQRHGQPGGHHHSAQPAAGEPSGKYSVTVGSPAKSAFSGLTENPLVGKKLKS